MEPHRITPHVFRDSEKIAILIWRRTALKDPEIMVPHEIIVYACTASLDDKLGTISARILHDKPYKLMTASG